MSAIASWGARITAALGRKPTPADFASMLRSLERPDAAHCIAVDGEHVCGEARDHADGHVWVSWDRVVVHGEPPFVRIEVRR